MGVRIGLTLSTIGVERALRNRVNLRKRYLVRLYE